MFRISFKHHYKASYTTTITSDPNLALVVQGIHLILGISSETTILNLRRPPNHICCQRQTMIKELQFSSSQGDRSLARPSRVVAPVPITSALHSTPPAGPQHNPQIDPIPFVRPHAWVSYPSNPCIYLKRHAVS